MHTCVVRHLALVSAVVVASTTALPLPLNILGQWPKTIYEPPLPDPTAPMRMPITIHLPLLHDPDGPGMHVAMDVQRYSDLEALMLAVCPLSSLQECTVALVRCTCHTCRSTALRVCYCLQ